MKTNEKIIIETVNFVKSNSVNEGSHDWWHVKRVWEMSKLIAKHEHCDQFIVEMASLLHDIEDWKFNEGTQKNIVEQWLIDEGINHNTRKKILDIINRLSFKGANVDDNMNSIEGKIVQDSDRLDAIGAIGISRAFSYGGFKRREIYNPSIPPKFHNSFESYKSSKSHTINHFYEKLLLLKDRMNTEFAKKLAEKRHEFMLLFLNEFFEEWNLNK